ncbi:thiamine pyrophosphate-binding protein [Hahella aquimaris]|uniref:thiamine pyrophosphate-binding protein n=1 Tax=Hahella sp. HNIBRBA332 TaxID=3015983 RepID=UPI00273C9D67|nr:thiamine pyrophosphate-binding protein [Hahella sp. HNIBRBA332]WLQ15605.1 thiamine pyrophosphate-binding protein [Hahella sp. HNIBRBA332]
MIENGDLILHYLERLGVKYVFGVPGGSIEPLYNALARSERRGGPKAVLARHESGAAFMADGYARATGKLGVCISTSGPGATNLLTGVANAYADGIPMLVITAQPSIERFGLGAFQEGSCTGINTVSIFDSCTRFNTLVSHPAQLEHKLLMAIGYALSNQPGPVHLSVPLDIMRAKSPDPAGIFNMRAFINHEVVPSAESMHRLLKELAYVQKATLVIGEGCAGAMEPLLALAESRNWLIVTTPMGKGLVSEYHPLYRGVFGLGGHESARDALHPDNAERVIVIGSALDEVTTGGWDPNAIFSNRLIHLSGNPDHLSRSVMSRLSILGSPRLLLEPFAKYLKHAAPRKLKYSPGADGFPQHVIYADKEACLDVEAPIKPQALYWALSQVCPRNTPVLMDTGNSFLWGVHYWRTNPPLSDSTKLFHIGMGFATMGWAIGAAVGMALAKPDTPVICFTGDGSMLMSGQEITVARELDLNILFIVLNDSHLGMIKHGQRLGRAEDIANRLPHVDFAAMAKAAGLASQRITRLKELDEIGVDSLFSKPGPFVLDVVVDSEQVPPMRQRTKVLTGGNHEQQIRIPDESLV